jgi:hypothetical protein
MSATCRAKEKQAPPPPIENTTPFFSAAFSPPMCVASVDSPVVVLFPSWGTNWSGHRDVYSSVVYELLNNFLTELNEMKELRSSQFSHFDYVSTRAKEMAIQRRKHRQQMKHEARSSPLHRHDHRLGQGHQGNSRNAFSSSTSASSSASFSASTSMSTDTTKDRASMQPNDSLEDMIELVDELCRTTPGTAEQFLLCSLDNSNYDFMIETNVQEDEKSKFVYDIYSYMDDDEISQARDLDLLLVPYINMLEAISIDNDSAKRVYLLLLHGDEREPLLGNNYQPPSSNSHLCSWKSFFDFLENYAEEMGEIGHSSNTYQTKKKSNKFDQDRLDQQGRLCIAILKLCQTVFRSPDLCQRFAGDVKFLQHLPDDQLDLDPINILFELLPREVESEVKGELMRTLAVFAKHCARRARRIWGYMEERQVLNTKLKSVREVFV